MSHSPSLSRHTPGAPEPSKFLPFPAIHTTFSAASSESDEILDTLRSAIAAGASALDPILTAIAEGAQTLTGASAAVIALRSQGTVVCRARSGDCAPDVGSPLNEKSGISGECLRTGKILRCDDTQKDYRVNAEVCRRLGLRSIAVLPLRSRLEIAGVLEVFSTRAYAFAETQMMLLGRLAELAEAAYTQQLSTEARVQPAPVEKAADLRPKPQTSSRPDEAALRRIGNRIRAEELGSGRKIYFRVGIAAALLTVVSVATWKMSTKPQHTGVQVANHITPPAAPPAESAEDSIPISLTNITARSQHGAGADSGMSVSVQRHPREDAESDPEVSDVVTRVTRKTPIESEAPSATPVPAERPAEQVANSVQEPEPAPKLEAVAAGPGALSNLLVPPTAVPKFSPPVSQGVSGGVLQHKVPPVYPSQAIAARIEGAVTLQATITPEGKVEKVKVVKGHPILAQAAMAAVRQWRYTPYQLNGQPTSVQADIVVNFKVPTN